MLQRLVFVYALMFLVIATLGCVVQDTHALPATELSCLFRVRGPQVLVHLLIGLAGIAASMIGPAACRAYGVVVGMAYLAVGVVRLLSPNAFGLMPIFGSDIVLHTLSGAIAMNFGFSRGFEAESVRIASPKSRFLHARALARTAAMLLAGVWHGPKAR